MPRHNVFRHVLSAHPIQVNLKKKAKLTTVTNISTVLLKLASEDESGLWASETKVVIVRIDQTS